MMQTVLLTVFWSFSFTQPSFALLSNAPKRSANDVDPMLLRQNAVESDSKVLTAKFPRSLFGRNLVISGDSNDREFITRICREFNGSLRVLSQVQLYFNNPWKVGSISYPAESRPRTCDFDKFNSSFLFLFHMGVTGDEPEETWHHAAVERRSETHWPQVGNMHVQIAPKELIRYVWPAAVKTILPTRPVIFLTQSSLWDTVSLEESNGCSQYTVRTPAKMWQHGSYVVNHVSMSDCERIFAAEWFDKASNYLRWLRHSAIHPDVVMWRTNPNCPLNNGLLNALHGRQAEAVVAAVRNATEGPWAGTKLVDWRSHYEATSDSQCNGIHYQKDGYLGYLHALEDALAGAS
mmetsp:Transcript_24224/g.63243  ORF Transcript_24224/g.63243 Transcript_24224/m.63243 type:complete len:349 (+) Transcript_24224:63-1109(+)